MLLFTGLASVPGLEFRLSAGGTPSYLFTEQRPSIKHIDKSIKYYHFSKISCKSSKADIVNASEFNEPKAITSHRVIKNGNPQLVTIVEYREGKDTVIGELPPFAGG